MINLKITENETPKKYDFYLNKESLKKQGNYYIYLDKDQIKYNNSRGLYGYRDWLPSEN